MNIIEQFIVAAAADHMIDYGNFIQADHLIDCGEFAPEHETPASIEAAMFLLDSQNCAIDEGDVVRYLTADEIEQRDMTLTAIDDYIGAF